VSAQNTAQGTANPQSFEVLCFPPNGLFSKVKSVNKYTVPAQKIARMRSEFVIIQVAAIKREETVDLKDEAGHRRD